MSLYNKKCESIGDLKNMIHLAELRENTLMVNTLTRVMEVIELDLQQIADQKRISQ